MWSGSLKMISLLTINVIREDNSSNSLRPAVVVVLPKDVDLGASKYVLRWRLLATVFEVPATVHVRQVGGRYLRKGYEGFGHVAADWLHFY